MAVDSDLGFVSEFEYLSTLMEEANDNDCEAELTTVEYAQCYTGMCTLNGDGKTATCGCLSLRPSEVYESKLKFGWASAVLAKSVAYQSAIKACVAGDSSYADIIATAIEDGSIYASYDFKSGPPDRISMNSKATPLGTFGMKTCDNEIYTAQCMGAPCWDYEYGGVWNTTCICPYTTYSDVVVKDMFSTICDEASTSGVGCAAVGFDSVSYEDDATGFKQMVHAVMNSSITVDTAVCPAEATTS